MAPRRGGSTGPDFLSLPFVFIDIPALFLTIVENRGVEESRSREVEGARVDSRRVGVPPHSGLAIGFSASQLLDFLSLPFVFIDILGLFPRFLHFLALLRVPDQTSSAALFPGERASVARQVRGGSMPETALDRSTF
jgi:hypothetical protein